MFSGRREAVLVDQPDAVVVRRAPDAGVRGHREPEVAGHLERRLLRERRVAGDVEGQLEAEHVAGAGAASLEEVADGRVGGPLPRAGLDVAVGQHEPAGHRLQRVDRGVGVVDRLQPVRPVDGGGDAGLERLPAPRAGCRRGCPRGGTSCRARGSTRRSTGSASSPRRTPASRSATCAGGCRSSPASRCRRTRRSPGCPRGRRGSGRPPRSGRRRPGRRRPRGSVWLSSMVSTVPPRRTIESVMGLLPYVMSV